MRRRKSMLHVIDRMYLNAMLRLAVLRQRAGEKARELWEDQKGSTSTIVVEIVMVGMILVLAFVFRKQIGGLFANLWKGLVHFDDDAGSVAPGSMENPFE